MSKHSQVVSLLALASLGCNPDSDRDGFPDSEDCAPKNASVFPGAEELCDRVDNDCNGVVDDIGLIRNDTREGTLDEKLFIVAYLDEDQDGQFAEETTVMVCKTDPTETYSKTPGLDCNDHNSSILDAFPPRNGKNDSPRVRNGEDNDCDGIVDGGITASAPQEIADLWPISNSSGWEGFLSREMYGHFSGGSIAYNHGSRDMFGSRLYHDGKFLGLDQGEELQVLQGIQKIADDETLYSLTMPWVSGHVLSTITDPVDLRDLTTQLTCAERFLQMPDLERLEAAHLHLAKAQFYSDMNCKEPDNVDALLAAEHMKGNSKPDSYTTERWEKSLLEMREDNCDSWKVRLADPKDDFTGEVRTLATAMYRSEYSPDMKRYMDKDPVFDSTTCDPTTMHRAYRLVHVYQAMTTDQALRAIGDLRESAQKRLDGSY